LLDRGEVWNESLESTVGGKIDLLFQKSTALNVAAKRKGSKAGLAPLVIGAHGDHLGLGDGGASLAKPDEQGQIHFGADDNASGVASLLELAHAWSHPKVKPERDIIFAMWSAEELGILGSTYFLKEWKGPKPFAYLNMDMVGRLRDSLSIQGVGSATEWRADFEAWAKNWSVPVNAVSDPYLPTDAMSFYVKEVPILSFFTGSHAEYHSPRDRYETLNFPGLVQTANMVNVVATDLAKASKKLTWLKVESGKPMNGEGRTFRLYLGTVPDYSQEGIKGVKISGTSKDSPAETAGLLSGDVIVGLGGIKIDSIYDYVYCLQALKADVAVPIQVVRAGRQMDLKITPRLKTGG
jgi:Zn-dependent M28 family amino/carboxypeptidase